MCLDFVCKCHYNCDIQNQGLITMIFPIANSMLPCNNSPRSFTHGMYVGLRTIWPSADDWFPAAASQPPPAPPPGTGCAFHTIDPTTPLSLCKHLMATSFSTTLPVTSLFSLYPHTDQHAFFMRTPIYIVLHLDFPSEVSNIDYVTISKWFLLCTFSLTHFFQVRYFPQQVERD